MSFDYRTIMNGQQKGAVASVARGVLTVASWPYRIAVARRNKKYDSGSSEVYQCGVPVICVGNLTTGGTGKTPIVCFLAKWLRSRDFQVAIISRGYGRGDGDTNDEALELHWRLPDVPHVQDPDRAEAARVAVEELEAQVILMDDGFQHRRLHRDLDIVVIDATCPFGFGSLLPRGLLREPLASLSRADVVIVTRCDAVEHSQVVSIETTIRMHHDSVPVLRSRHQPATLLEHPATESPIDALAGKRVATLCAIGNPNAFEDTVRRCNATIIGSRRLSDHDPYSPDTVCQLREWIQSLGENIDQVVCTHKDLVKLRTDRLGGKPLAAVQIDLTIDKDDADILHELLKQIGERDRRSATGATSC